MKPSSNPLAQLTARARTFLSHPAMQSATQPLLSAIDEGTRAKMGGDYDAALLAFARGEREIESFGVNPRRVLPVRAQRIETLVLAECFDEADVLLEETAASRVSDPQMAAQNRIYFDILRGLLAQARGQGDRARESFETARAQAKAIPLPSAEARAACHIAELAYADGSIDYALHLLREYTPQLAVSTLDMQWLPHFLGLIGLAEITLGQEAEGHQHLGRALAAAEDAGDRRHIRRWSLALAERALTEARFHDAQAHLERAIAAADAASSDPSAPREGVRARIALSRNLTFQGQLEPAVEMARSADEAAQRLADPNALHHARIALGIALSAAGRAAEAIDPLAAAVEPLLATDSKLASDDLDALRAYANALSEIGSYDKAITIYTRAGQQAERAGLRLATAQVQRDLGLTYLHMNRPADALAVWQPIVSHFEDQGLHGQAARLYCDIANARRALGQGPRALRDIENALTALNKVDSYDLETRGLVLSNAALAYGDIGDIESADAFFSESIAIAERLGDTSAESIRAGNYGWFLLTIGKPRRAIAALERALRLSSERPAMRLESAVQTDNLGLACDNLNDYPAALAHHQQALVLLGDLDQPYWRAIFRIHEGISHLSLMALDAAAACFREALALSDLDAQPQPASASEAAPTPESAARVEVAVRVQIALTMEALRAGDPARTVAGLEHAIARARRLDMRRWLAEALAVRSQQQAALGDLPLAAQTWEEAARLYRLLHMPQSKLSPAWLT